MTFDEFNNQEKPVISDSLFTCCSSEKWTALQLKEFPFESEKELISNATRIWYEQCGKADWIEAFRHHPKIGDLKTLQDKFGSTKHLAGDEQASLTLASDELLGQLMDANKAYEEKFGFIFIVSATGKSAREMFSLLNERMKNSAEEELNVAMNEQHKITIIRLKKLISGGAWAWMRNSQITTHVLDVSIGKPASGMTIKLLQKSNGHWHTITQGLTTRDGRISDMLPPEKILTPGNYKLIFETEDYLQRNSFQVFYPEVQICFNIFDDLHYHLPLLLNPFGYTTYRGS